MKLLASYFAALFALTAAATVDAATQSEIEAYDLGRCFGIAEAARELGQTATMNGEEISKFYSLKGHEATLATNARESMYVAYQGNEDAHRVFEERCTGGE